MHSYCLFCDTQRCGVIAELLERCGVDRAFSPKLVGRERKQGVLLEKRYDLLPGYVFLFSRQALPDLREYRWIDGLIRYVGRAEDQYELTGGDRSFADALFEQDGILRAGGGEREPPGKCILRRPGRGDPGGSQTAARQGRLRV